MIILSDGIMLYTLYPTGVDSVIVIGCYELATATFIHRIKYVAIMFLSHSINSIITVGIADHARKFNFTISHLFYFSPKSSIILLT